MQLFKRRTTVSLDLTPEESNDVASFSSSVHDWESLQDVVERNLDSWPLLYKALENALAEEEIAIAYRWASHCLALRPDDPRSKFPLMMVYQLLSQATMKDNSDNLERYYRAQGHDGPIDDPSLKMAAVLTALNLDIDWVIAEQRRLINELLALKINHAIRHELKRALNMNRYAADYRSGKIARQFEKRHR